MQRRAHHHNSSSMGGILAPEARPPPPKNFHKQNLDQMAQKENEIQRKRDEEVKQQQDGESQWKMKRFQSVESKVRQDNMVGAAAQGDLYQGAAPNNSQPQRKMTKAEAMKQRMAEQRANGNTSQLPPQMPTAQPQRQAAPGGIQMENIQMERGNNGPKLNPGSLPPRQPPKAGSVRRSMNAAEDKRSLGGESIYDFKEPQPKVVQYTKEQTYQAPPESKIAPKRKPHVYTGLKRSNSVQNRAAQNAGAAILSSQGSQRQMAAAQATKENVPRSNETAQLNPRQAKNFVKDNTNKAIFGLKPPTSKAADEATIAGKNKNYGKVPSYLNKYQKEREDHQKQVAIDEEMAKHPPGTRLMPESERQETLRDLHEAKDETNRQLERLPIVSHSRKAEQHKKDLEEKMSRLDRALETFSKPTVYVAM